MSEPVVSAMIRVIGEMIVLKQKQKTKSRKREWVRKWIGRRSALGIPNTLIKELAAEDTESFYNFLRMNENMFNTLLEMVYIMLHILFIPILSSMT